MSFDVDVIILIDMCNYSFGFVIIFVVVRNGESVGIVVVYVNQGDDVYIKIYFFYYGGGGILSEGFGRFLFLGWKLN